MSLESGPFFTMLTLGVAGLAAFPWQAFVGAILPLIIGMILGNLDKDMREVLGRAVPVLVPFFASALGAGLLGVLLGVGVVVVTGVFLLAMDRLTGGDGVVGVAAASSAGNAVGVPAAVAAVNSAYAPVAAQATALVAASVIVTAILVPIVTA